MATLKNRIPWTYTTLSQAKIEAWLEQPNNVPTYFLKSYEHLPPLVPGKCAPTTKLSGITSIQYLCPTTSDGDIGRAKAERYGIIDQRELSETGGWCCENQDLFSDVDDVVTPLLKKTSLYSLDPW